MSPGWEPCYRFVQKSYGLWEEPIWPDLLQIYAENFNLAFATVWNVMNLSVTFSHSSHYLLVPNMAASTLASWPLCITWLFLKSFLLSFSLIHCIYCSLNPSDSSLKKKSRSTSFFSFLPSEDKPYYQSFSTIYSPSGWAHALLYGWHLNFCFQL